MVLFDFQKFYIKSFNPFLFSHQLVMLRKTFLAAKVIETITHVFVHCFYDFFLTCKYLISEIYSDLSGDVDH